VPLAQSECCLRLERLPFAGRDDSGRDGRRVRYNHTSLSASEEVTTLGFRFRRSIRIAPGLRLNLSPSGVSATVGPRGASVSFGRRGTYLNVGLPGTGLSYRERLDNPPTRSGARSTYRQLMKELRDAEKAQDRADAAAEYEQSEQRLHSLREVLLGRNREPYDWYQRWGPRGSYREQAFTPPEPGFSEHELASAVAKRIRITWWALPAVLLAGTALSLGSPLVKALALLLLIGVAGAAHRLRSVRQKIARDLLQLRNDEFARDTSLLQRDHELIEAANRRDWEREEEQREVVRTAEARDDPEPLAAVLEAELANEALPVPLVVELEMPSVRFVRLELSLPEMAEIPEERAELTKTGRLSRRKMSQRDRVALYADVCCGVALLLVYEVFRVLPMVSAAEVFGITEAVDPATGRLQDFVGLHLHTDRPSFEGLNLDAIDPSSALAGLDGRLSMNRKGELSPLPDMVGLLSE
jgi:hypothetical protein